MKRKLFFLMCWIVGIIFPFGALTLLSRTFAVWFNWLFAAEVMHVIMHASLFGVLAVALALTLAPSAHIASPLATPRPLQRLSVQLLCIWLIVAAVAMLQELVQLTYKARVWSFAETYDLGTDLAGAAVGLIVLWLYSRVTQ